jgi:hypothetical protein
VGRQRWFGIHADLLGTRYNVLCAQATHVRYDVLRARDVEGAMGEMQGRARRGGVTRKRAGCGRRERGGTWKACEVRDVEGARGMRTGARSVVMNRLDCLDCLK